MDVFVFGGEDDFTRLYVIQNFNERFADQTGVVRRNDARLAQHGRVGDGTGDVLAIHALVVVDGGVQRVHQLVGVFFKAAGPKFHNMSPVSK